MNKSDVENMSEWELKERVLDLEGRIEGYEEIIKLIENGEKQKAEWKEIEKGMKTLELNILKMVSHYRHCHKCQKGGKK